MQSDDGRTVIETDRMTIAENNFFLKGKPFKLDNHPPFRAIYQIRSPKMVVCSGRQVGKTCLGSSPILTENGRYTRLDALQVGAKVISMDAQYQTVSRPVTALVYSGAKPCYRITTRMGHVLEVAGTHPLRTLFGYTRADELRVGDRVASMRRAGLFTGSQSMPLAEAAILAYTLGDGYINGDDRVDFTNVKPVVLDDFKNHLRALGISYGMSTRKNSDVIAIRTHRHVRMRELLTHHRISNLRSDTKFIPVDVFSLDRGTTAFFINRLWATDGHVKRYPTGRYDVSYCSISQDLIRGLQALLWKFGIPTSIREKIPAVYVGTTKVAYEMRIETQNGVRLFLSEIGALGKSEDIRLPTTTENNNRDTVPQEVQTLITRLYDVALAEKRIRGKGGPRKTGVSLQDYNLRRTLKYPPTPAKVWRYAWFFDEVAGFGINEDVATLYALATADVLWDEIKTIAPIGEHACYDIEVEELHNYVLNGVVTHNSTLISTFTVADAIGRSFWESLTIHPSLKQSNRFSNMRIAPIIEQSPSIKKYFFDNTCRNNTSDRSLTNHSTMYFGAMSQLDNLRGLSANSVNEDEVQDMNGDDIAIIEEVMSGQHSSERFIVRTGTAKTVGNILEATFRDSTMNEWIVPCSDVKCGAWNIPSAENIGLKGFICKRCKAVCDVRQGKWRAMRAFDDAKWIGFRIPQIILPTHTEDPGAWAVILDKKDTMDPIPFANEVMGQAAGSGISILDEDHLKACCQPEFEMIFDYLPTTDRYYAVFATIDWGLTARKSFTVLGIWGVTEGLRLKLIMMKRYQETDILKQVDDIAENCLKFTVDSIGADWGAGVVQSRLLEVKLNRLVNRFMYVSEQQELIKWDPRSELFKVNRTQAMSEAFIKMRMKQYWFPHWAEFKTFGADILNVYEEPLDDRSNNEKIKYSHSEDRTDDCMHVAVYANLLLFMMQNNLKRPGHQ